ncbi:MAG TPA: 2-dehydro-3-deoxygalactonokinase [Stellaceae bacterium]|nr:2-dehydro-3-deoxygalactonokinase [Stellaceae bacterium]
MIAVDWGTSSFRAYRLDAAGRIRDRRAAPAGILSVAEGGFPAALETQLGDWIEETPILMSGMVGSRQGWLEAPYADCPAGAAEIARLMRRVSWEGGRREAWIVPGLACRDAAAVADVMRGEETQILGAAEELPEGAAILCLPGTHSKWVRLDSGRILDFATAMTGEAFAVLRRHSILGRLMPPEGAAAAITADAAFDAGLARAGDPGGLLHHLFGVRSRALFGEIAPAALPAYLSGVLIGRELADLLPREGGIVHIIAEPGLARLYAHALAAAGRKARILDPDCVARGLYRLAAHLPKRGGHG